MIRFFLVVLFLPATVFAIQVDADRQCVSGGVVGQPCKDTTNGYVTQGKCVHINVCQATSFPKSPKEKICDGVVCRPGQVPGNDYGKKVPVVATSPVVTDKPNTDILQYFAEMPDGTKSGASSTQTLQEIASTPTYAPVSESDRRSIEDFLASYQYPEEGTALTEAPRQLVEIMKNPSLEKEFVTMAVPELAQQAKRVEAPQDPTVRSLFEQTFLNNSTGFSGSSADEGGSLWGRLKLLLTKMTSILSALIFGKN